MYEKEWRNAEEHEGKDNDQLEQRKNEKSFIANVPKCQQMPLVLPSKDEPQFRRLLSKKARKSETEATTSQGSYQPEKMEVDEFVDKKNVKRESFVENDKTDVGISPTVKKSIAAGVTLKTLIADKDSSLMLFQLPTSLSTVSDENRSNDFSGQSTSQASTSKLSGQMGQGKETQRHCLGAFPAGVEIGKLQILRSGRVVMKIGEQILDVAEAIPSQCYETAVRIETQPIESQPTAGNRSDFFSRVPNGLTSNSSTPPTNSIQILGEIPYSFCASIDYSRTRSKLEKDS